MQNTLAATYLAPLRTLGLSEAGVLGSIGVQRHQARVQQGAIAPAVLLTFAQDLAHLTQLTSADNSTISVDFWDVESPRMQRDGWDVYRLAHFLSQPEYVPYVRLLGRSFQYLARVRRGERTAVGVACDILCDCARYVAAGEPVLPATRVRRDPTRQALTLWLHIVAGASRRLPLVGWELLPQSIWTRCNVATMWEYQIGKPLSASAIWGLSGFHQDFIGTSHNNNQIEHLTISAYLQIARHVPLAALNLVEVGEWLLPPHAPFAEARADMRLNRAITRHFAPRFQVDRPSHACRALELALASPA